MALCVAASFFLCESPKWLMLVDRRDEAVKTLVKLCGLPAHHPRMQLEIRDIESSIGRSKAGDHGSSKPVGIFKETFTVPPNLRRLQQILIAFALAQLSGANSITTYFVPILTIMGLGGDTARSIFLSGMYGFTKLMFSFIASFCFIDALGRRKSLFIGITIQMISDIYIGMYIKYDQEGIFSNPASQAAATVLFINAWGYAVGLFVLPYVFGGELWPKRIRSFGGALGATFHWLFLYAFKFALPSLLTKIDNWGAFLFFAGSCFVALIYVYLMVPEVAGLSVQEIDETFKGPWFTASKRTKRPAIIEAEGSVHGTEVDQVALEGKY